MKTNLNHLFRGLFILLALVCTSPLFAQDDAGFFTVSGTVRDQGTRRPLANVSVSVPDTRVGTVTNADGTFSIKVRHDLQASELEFSHLGYQINRQPIRQSDQSGLTVHLTESPVMLSNVVVINQEGRPLVDEAMRRIGSNYSDRSTMLTGFYRETVQKRNSYINISEAVVQIYRAPYSDELRVERMQLIKGRQLVSPRAVDTLSVKLQGGPNTYIYCDIVKNREMLLDREVLDYYRFRVEGNVVIDDLPHYVVAFEPQVIFPDYALYVGKLYIERESLTISRAEFGFDMRDRDKVTRMILRKKPGSLRFSPDEVSYVLNYQKRDGRSYLYYTSTRIRFQCDWRRRFFATNYTILSEMVITDGEDEGVTPIPFRQSFRSDHSLSDKVSDFYDPDFWEDYNIIEPTESLESAVNRLKRRIE